MLTNLSHDDQLTASQWLNAQEDMGRHPQYKPLPIEGHFIRLVQLLPERHSKQISCRLRQANLDCLEDAYTAISYTWGPPNPQQTILLDNIEYTIRSSLYELLEELRDPQEVKTIWIDALCIDQTSLTERNHQVSHMGDIFAKANNVKAWLGHSQRDVKEAIRYINEVTDLSEVRQMQLPSHAIERVESSIRLLENLKYWSRAWIIQELILAKDVTFFSGQECISWDQLVQVVSMVDKEKARHLRTIIITKFLGVGTWPLEELFIKFGHLACADDRDKIYSLYGMVEGESISAGALPAPDYSLCINEILVQHVKLRNGSFMTSDQMDFVRSFVFYITSLRTLQRVCSCHVRAMLDLRLDYYGEFRPVTPKPSASSSGGASGQTGGRSPNLVLHSNSDIYKFRQFKTDGSLCVPRATDRAFHLNNQWYLVWRLARQTPSPQSENTGGVIGLVRHYPNESKFFSVAEVDESYSGVTGVEGRLLEIDPSLEWTQRAHPFDKIEQRWDAEVEDQWKKHLDESELLVHIELGLLFRLAAFMNVEDGNHDRLAESRRGESVKGGMLFNES